MTQLFAKNAQEESLKILGKGMITLPKKWRDELAIVPGDRVKARKDGNKVIIELESKQLAPYRVYTDEEIDEFLKEDQLPQALVKKVDAHLTHLSTDK